MVVYLLSKTIHLFIISYMIDTDNESLNSYFEQSVRSECRVWRTRATLMPYQHALGSPTRLTRLTQCSSASPADTLSNHASPLARTKCHGTTPLWHGALPRKARQILKRVPICRQRDSLANAAKATPTLCIFNTEYTRCSMTLYRSFKILKQFEDKIVIECY